LIVSLALFLAVGLMQVGTVQAHVQEAAASSDPWSQKPVLPYLLLTKDERLEKEAQNLFDALGLSEQEKGMMHQIALEEQQQMRDLYAETQLIVQDETLSPADKKTDIQDTRYNERVAEIMMGTDQAVRQLLGSRYPLFRTRISD